MRCKGWFLAIAVLFAGVLFAVDRMTIEHSKKEPVYRCGESAGFTLTAFDGDKKSVSGKYFAEFLFCGNRSIKKVPIDFSKGNPVKLECSIKEPGFVLVKIQDEKGATVKFDKKLMYAGAAFEPEKIKKAYEMPDDFMAFWENNRKLLEKVPVVLEKIDKFSTAQYTTYYISVNSLNDENISGYLTIPCKKGKYPILVSVPGAGAGISSPMINYAKLNVITLSVNVHKFLTADNHEEQKKRYIADGKKGYYPYRGVDNKSKYFFCSTYAGIDRMINYLASREEFDGKHLVVEGSSQGGGSALILTGLNKNVTAMAANVPALCDHGAHKIGRAPGWPNLSKKPQAEAIAPYFDAANFASLVKVPALVSCGFIDTTCSPSSVYAAFNELKGEKQMIHVPLEGHTYSRKYGNARRAFVHKQLGIGK